MSRGIKTKTKRLTFKVTEGIYKLLMDSACKRHETLTNAIEKALILYSETDINDHEINELAARIKSEMILKDLYQLKRMRNRYRYWYNNAFTSIISIQRTQINSGNSVNMMQVKKMIREEIKLYNEFPPDIRDELREQKDNLMGLNNETRIKYHCSRILDDSTRTL